jgi:hypothetical protein
MEAKVFKTNPNSRDLKGWSCVCIGIFHESKESLTLLLNHGGDPLLRSSYNKNAWDLAKVVYCHHVCMLWVKAVFLILLMTAVVSVVSYIYMNTMPYYVSCHIIVSFRYVPCCLSIGRFGCC